MGVDSGHIFFYHSLLFPITTREATTADLAVAAHCFFSPRLLPLVQMQKLDLLCIFQPVSPPAPPNNAVRKVGKGVTPFGQ